MTYKPFGRAVAGLAAVLAVAGASAAAASGPAGVPGFHIKENHARMKATGPGFTVKLDKHRIRARIDEDRFGIPSAGFPIVADEIDMGPVGPQLRPFICENGTYTIRAGTFKTTERASTTQGRPAPYTPAFNANFPIQTFVGEINATVTNAAGESFQLVMSDLVHELLTPSSFAATAPIHGFFTDADGRVVDRVSLIGRVNIDRATGAAEYEIEDRGTCRQHANLGPGGDQAVVTGPFFVLPFNAPLVER